MRPRSSKLIVTGWRTIGSLATRWTSKPSGTFMRLSASAGLKPWPLPQETADPNKNTRDTDLRSVEIMFGKGVGIPVNVVRETNTPVGKLLGVDETQNPHHLSAPLTSYPDNFFTSRTNS